MHDLDLMQPKYLVLAGMLRRRIHDRSLLPNQHAPSISELSTELGGSARQTCVRALNLLVDEGLLTCSPGWGYFVVAPQAGSV